MASLRLRKYREREDAFLVEGADLVAAGIASGRRPQLVFVRAERGDELVAALGLDALPGEGPPPAVYPVIERVAAKLSALETPPDALAVFPLPSRSLAVLRGAGTSPKTPASRRAGAAASPAPLVVYVDGVQDPGNLGTLLRAAVAFGAAALVTSPGAADLYAPKTVRASMGAIFGLPLAAGAQLADVLEALGAATVYGLAAHGGAALPSADLRRPAVLVIGAEREGLSPAARRAVTEYLTIPLAPERPAAIESLNAGVAGAVALYEFARRAAGASDDPRPGAAAKG